MGLDMYAEVTREKPDTPTDFVVKESQELAYWRKHPDLHGWMEQLYREKGGTEEVFNCVPVQLTEEDLDKLEKDVNNDALPNTVGFFFGESCEEDKERDLKFITSARAAIKDGWTVFYTSWW